jgi:hypothetical protein
LPIKLLGENGWSGYRDFYLVRAKVAKKEVANAGAVRGEGAHH